MSIPKFAPASGNFHLDLKKRIQEYFVQTGKSTTGGSKLFLKAVSFYRFSWLYIFT